MNHPNTVVGIEALLLHDTAMPAQLAAENDGIEARLAIELPSDPLIGGLQLAASDLERCRRVITENRVPFIDRGNELHIGASAALGAELRVRQAA